MLMKMSGSVRKFTMATSESMLLTARAIAVNTEERPSPSNAKAKNTPMKSTTPKLEGSSKPFGMTSAIMKVNTARNIAFTRFWTTPERNIRGPRYGSCEEGVEESELSVQNEIDAPESHIEDKD